MPELNRVQQLAIQGPRTRPGVTRPPRQCPSRHELGRCGLLYDHDGKHMNTYEGEKITWD